MGFCGVRERRFELGELAELQQGGLSADIPWIIAEYGFSALAARAEVNMDGALFNADSVAHFLSLGGAAAYLYGYEPGEIFERAGLELDVDIRLIGVGDQVLGLLQRL
jgi:hypothetical protein